MNDGSFKKLGGKDYCAYWFEAMQALGLDDRVDALRVDPREPQRTLEVRRYSHALCDGYGTYQMLGRDLGDVYEFLDEPSSPRPPLSLWQALSAPNQKNPLGDVKRRPIAWAAPVRQGVQPVEVVRSQTVFTPAQMEGVRAAAAAARCSAYSWVTWAIHQTVSRTLLAQPAPLCWTYMVSMRPWVALERIESNHISGLELVIGPQTSARGVADEVKARFAANDHWRGWYGSRIGRVVGRWGVRQIYRLVRDMAHTAGHISHSGRIRNRSGQIWALTGIPSPGAPLNFNTQELNGHLAVGLKVDEQFGFSAAAPDAQAILQALQDFVAEACSALPGAAADNHAR